MSGTIECFIPQPPDYNDPLKSVYIISILSPNISLGSEKENLFNNQKLL